MSFLFLCSLFWRTTRIHSESTTIFILHQRPFLTDACLLYTDHFKVFSSTASSIDYVSIQSNFDTLVYWCLIGELGLNFGKRRFLWNPLRLCFPTFLAVNLYHTRTPSKRSVISSTSTDTVLLSAIAFQNVWRLITWIIWPFSPTILNTLRPALSKKLCLLFRDPIPFPQMWLSCLRKGLFPLKRTSSYRLSYPSRLL